MHFSQYFGRILEYWESFKLKKCFLEEKFTKDPGWNLLKNVYLKLKADFENKESACRRLEVFLNVRLFKAEIFPNSTSFSKILENVLLVTYKTG